MFFTTLEYRPQPRLTVPATSIIRRAAGSTSSDSGLPRHVSLLQLRDLILERVWGDASVESNAIEVHIGRLRDKLEADGEERLIQTIRGAGYALREEV